MPHAGLNRDEPRPLVEDSYWFRGTTRHAVNRRIGAGGMGVVYEAQDRTTGEIVALKTLQRWSPNSLYRLKREFRSLSALVHPNLVQFYELISEGDRWYLTMELVEEAQDFATWVRNGRPVLDRPRSYWDLFPESSALIQDAAKHETETSDGPSSSAGIGSSASQLGTIATAAGTDAGLIDRRNGPSGTTIATDAAPGPRAAEPQAGYHARRTPTGPIAVSGILRDLNGVDGVRLESALDQLVRAVEALHRAGRLHRDLKPGNVVVDAHGRLVVLDFGLVAEIDRTGHWSGAHDISGTAGFMSPEQGAGGSLTPASDWYSVGVMLFQVLTGRMPFTGDPRSVLAQKQQRNGPSPSELVRGVPEVLDRLVADLLRLDPGDRPDGPEIRRRLGRSPGTTIELSAPETCFVGRANHLAEVRAAIDRTSAGAATVIHLHGPSGAGKSALAEQTIAQARRAGFLVLSGRCYENESVPYKGVDSLVDELSRHLVAARGAHPALPPGTASLARIFPVLRRVPAIGRLEISAGGDPRQERHLAFTALRRMLLDLAAERPVLLHLDDLQWGDADAAEALLALLTGLANRGDTAQAAALGRTLVLLTWRSEERDRSPCLALLTGASSAVARSWQVVDLPVGPLGDDEAYDLAVRLLADPAADARALVRWAGGSAFLLWELVRCRNEGIALGSATRDLATLLAERIARLDDEARQLLEVCCVAGVPLRPAEALDAAGLATSAPKAMVQLSHGRLLRRTGSGRIEPYHDRVREIVVAGLDRARMRALHGALARVLMASVDADIHQVATHQLAAGDRARAARTFLMAAEQAGRSCAIDRARACWEQAALLADDPLAKAKAQEGLIHVLTDAGRFREAYDVCCAAVRPFGVRLPRTLVGPRLLPLLGRVALRLRGRSLESLHQLAPADDATHEALVCLLDAVAKAAYQIQPERCVYVAATIVDRCLTVGVTADCAVGFLVYGVIFRGAVLGDPVLGQAWGGLALALADRFGNDRLRAELLFVTGYFATCRVASPDQAKTRWREALAQARASSDHFHAGCAAVGLGLLACLDGGPLPQQAAVIADLQGEIAALHQGEACLALQGLAGHVARMALDSSAGPGTGTGRQRRRRTSQAGAAEVAADDQAALAPPPLPDASVHQIPHFALIHPVLLAWRLLLADQPAEALEALDRARPLVKDCPGMPQTAEHGFLTGLAQAQLGRRRPAQTALRQLTRWAAINSARFVPRRDLLAAACGEGFAELLWQKALQSAQDQDDLALAVLVAHGAVQRADGRRVEVWLEVERTCRQAWGGGRRPNSGA